MNTPICDFIRRYANSNTSRLHMPGHKGRPLLGFESLDITEIDGADSLYEANGIIAESEANASSLFGCPTFYSTEGSSQCIRAMVYLAVLHAKEQGTRPLIAAGRNAHKTFLSAAALLDVDVAWMYPDNQASYLSCLVDGDYLDAFLSETPATAVYVTSPDYLGNVTDIAALAAVCRRHGALLLTDNAHGAYLRFLQPSRHPMDLGADLCCDSVHKTLPALTGSAYLHIASAKLAEQAKEALSLFGSTSPSYLILQSLDAVNAYLDDGYPEKLARFSEAVDALKIRLSDHGYSLCGSEPLKITIAAKSYGLEGRALAWFLRIRGLECEFSDPDHLVLMMTPENDPAVLQRLERALLSIRPNTPLTTQPPRFSLPRRAMSIREAMLSPSLSIPAEESLGRVLSSASVGCPPAVPIVVSGEIIDENAVRSFAYYNIDTCTVVK